MRLLNMLLGNVPEEGCNDMASWPWIVVIYTSVILVLTVIGRMVF
jgi:hypothetical protein